MKIHEIRFLSRLIYDATSGFLLLDICLLIVDVLARYPVNFPELVSPTNDESHLVLPKKEIMGLHREMARLLSASKNVKYPLVSVRAERTFEQGAALQWNVCATTSKDPCSDNTVFIGIVSAKEPFHFTNYSDGITVANNGFVTIERFGTVYYDGDKCENIIWLQSRLAVKPKKKFTFRCSVDLASETLWMSAQDEGPLIATVQISEIGKYKPVIQFYNHNAQFSICSSTIEHPNNQENKINITR